MQDIHSIGGGGGGGGGRLFVGGGGDRRLRPHHHHQHPHHQNHQALKCPRCDSLNTKFCYYNNYNLSQPRHFCKNCRRYWTKGGVLRNVPVGGGCRKTKRSKPKQTSAPDATETATATATTPTTPPPAPVLQERQRERRSNSHSSSESSSLTVTNTTATVNNTAAEAVSSTNNPLTRVGESNKLFEHVNMGSSFEPAGLMEQGSAAAAADCAIFSEIGSFTSLITSTHDMSFGFNDMLSQQNLEAQHGNNNNSAGDDNNQQWGQQQQHGMKFEMGGGPLMDDQTVQVDQLNGSRGFGGLDWQGGGGGDHHQDLFDIPNAVDHGYWSQSQWSDHQDHPSLYLP